MPEQTGRRAESFPSLTARKHWGRYALGVLTETGFVLALTTVGFLLAVIALVIWQ